MQLLALALFSISMGPPASAIEPAREGPASQEPRERASQPLRNYLRRPIPVGPRFLDHGVIALTGAGGTPHVYRLDLRVGLFDHVSVGVTSHWLPGQRAPRVWPVGAIALFRWTGKARVGVEVGAHYRPVLFPAPDPGAFVPRTQMVLGSVVMSSGWISAGLDVGAAHTRIPVVDPTDIESFRRRVVFAGGPFMRVGNRRAGVTADALAVLSPDPLLVFEVAVDVRFGAFAERRI